MIDRILKNTAATVRVQVTVGETGTDPSPDSATVTATGLDGTELFTDAAATNETSRVFAYTLTPTHTASLDLLRLDWTFTLTGVQQTLTTYAEVVGGYHFTLAELRRLDPLSNTDEYPTARLLEARTLAETTIEDACGVAFVPRYRYRTINGPGTDTLFLPDPRVTTVRSATVSDTALTSSELADLVVDDDGTVYNPSRWAAGTRNTVIGYEHGYPYCPPDVSRASLLLARWYLVDSPIDDRYTTVSTERGTFSLITPGMRGAVTSIPEVNAVIASYRQPVIA